MMRRVAVTGMSGISALVAVLPASASLAAGDFDSLRISDMR